jgi:hypothetical protein
MKKKESKLKNLKTPKPKKKNAEKLAEALKQNLLRRKNAKPASN